MRSARRHMTQVDTRRSDQKERKEKTNGVELLYRLGKCQLYHDVVEFVPYSMLPTDW